jgi:hypothetical protein
MSATRVKLGRHGFEIDTAKLEGLKTGRDIHMRWILTAAMAVCLGGATNAGAGSVGDLKVVAKEGTWELRHGKDTFSDKPSCVITVAAKPYIQIERGAFSVGYRGRGGVQMYEVRLDDEPESRPALPSDTEKQGGFLIWRNDAFETIMKAKRVRIKAFTVLSSVLTDDIDMKGTDRLYARLRELCPEEPRRGSR